MDAYAWYTTNHQAQERLQDHINTAAKHRLAQHAPVAHTPPRRRLRLTLSDLLSTVRRRVLGARSSTTPSLYADIATTPTREPTAIE